MNKKEKMANKAPYNYNIIIYLEKNYDCPSEVRAIFNKWMQCGYSYKNERTIVCRLLGIPESVLFVKKGGVEDYTNFLNRIEKELNNVSDD